ncbi:universal stress protein [Kitasatospora terrestris]|uniref:Universal stress protein n=1 Tax=Kitasatospora terrestris TaxID=258051 RepID=A0ABP9EJH3_9ACTN
MSRHILAGVDGTPQSEAAAFWAAEEAERRGTALLIVHVWPWLGTGDVDAFWPGDLRPAALRALTDIERRIRDARPGLAVETALVGDDPADGLVSVARGHELLVLGSRGLSGFAGLLVGSVGLSVAARADVPVVMVRAAKPAGAEEAGHGEPEVVVGLDLRHPAEEVLDLAFEEAELRGARLRAVHGWDLVPAWSATGWMAPQVDTAEQEASRKAALAEALAPWRAKYPDTAVVEEVRLGGAAQAVLTHSAGAALVVVGRRDRPLGLGARLGSVAHAVLHHAQAAVAVVSHA